MQKKKRYFIYKITNLLNGKIYIGVHNGNKPNYMGSGTALIKDIKKFGVENFKRRILKRFSRKKQAYDYEKKKVDKKFVEREDTYNRMTGGGGYRPCEINGLECEVDGIKYACGSDAALFLGINRNVLYDRLQSSNFPTYISKYYKKQNRRRSHSKLPVIIDGKKIQDINASTEKNRNKS